MRSCAAIRARHRAQAGHPFRLAAELVKKVEAGEPFDVDHPVVRRRAADQQAKVVANSRTVIGRTGVGIAVPRGAAGPTSARSTRSSANCSTPKLATSGDGSSGRYVMTLLDRLGIADQVKPKIKTGANGHRGQLLAEGEVDFAVIGHSAGRGRAGHRMAGWLPDEINSWLVFTGGISVAAKEPEAGRALLKFLITPGAVRCSRPRASSRSRRSAKSTDPDGRHGTVTSQGLSSATTGATAMLSSMRLIGAAAGAALPPMPRRRTSPFANISATIRCSRSAPTASRAARR